MPQEEVSWAKSHAGSDVCNAYADPYRAHMFDLRTIGLTFPENGGIDARY